jgi:hypothetical protein
MDLFGRIALPNDDVEADLGLPQQEINTLDEPVWQTLLRDVANVGIKLCHVIFPFWGSVKRMNRLQDWDLWGPLILSFILASILTIAAGNQEGLIFTTVFVVVWLGSGVVTINAILLGGKVSFFQSVCALGYCLGPMDVAAFACIWWDNIIFRIVLVACCFSWSVFASWGFVKAMMPKDTGRNILVLYPIFLFFFVIAWMVVVAHDVAE